MCYVRLVLRIWSKTLQLEKVGENFSNINKVKLYKNNHYFPSYCKFCFISKNKILFYGLLLFIFWIRYIYIYGGGAKSFKCLGPLKVLIRLWLWKFVVIKSIMWLQNNITGSKYPDVWRTWLKSTQQLAQVKTLHANKHLHRLTWWWELRTNTVKLVMKRLSLSKQALEHSC